MQPPRGTRKDLKEGGPSHATPTTHHKHRRGRMRVAAQSTKEMETMATNMKNIN